MPENKLVVTDARTGKQYDLPITDGTIKAMDLRAIQTDPEDFGVLAHDPAFTNTTSCRSAITFIDGDKGILEYRGYSISDLAEKASFTEIQWLLLNGEMPDRAQHDRWTGDLASRAKLPAGLLETLRGVPRDGHPMSVLMTLVAALGAYNPECRNVRDAAVRGEHIRRILAQMPLLAGAAWRHRQGWPQLASKPELGYVGNFLRQVFAKDESDAKAVSPVLVRAMDVLLTLHADHEQNCSTNAMRGVGSSEADPYSSTGAAIAALSGPLHGGANEEVLRMLAEIGSTANIPSFLEKVRAKKAKLMGFGHRVYKSYDPRAKIIARTAKEVFEVTGKNPLLEVAVELERIALSEPYFIERNLYPNVDFYSGLIYQSMGFDPAYFTVLFAVGRAPGWLSQWDEMLRDSEQKIARPRQIYTGHRGRKLAR
ncbi:MAG: Citrate synthase [Planctomycetes bacterium]|nr:Citrate synthase [Planctomycetota bacterium]